MNHLPQDPFSQGTRNHMTADILAIMANGKVVETEAGQNHVLSAYGDHAVEALKERRCKIIGTHDLDGHMMVHALVLPPVFSLSTWTWGDLAILIGLVWLALILIFVKFWSSAIAHNLKDVDNDKDEGFDD